jgi:hypothetical protein
MDANSEKPDETHKGGSKITAKDAKGAKKGMKTSICLSYGHFEKSCNIRDALKIKNKSTAKRREKARKISKGFFLKQIIRLPPVLIFRVLSRLFAVKN